MTKTIKYKCVNCGEPAAALIKTYGPTVLKLTKCEKCKGIVDKYIEYDPVIVMIDLVLMSREAQRHILYNTEFKLYWKLLIILTMIETLGVWKNYSPLDTTVNTSCCNNTINTTYLSTSVNVSGPICWRGRGGSRWDDAQLFLAEKEFYIQFISTFAGKVACMVMVHSLMQMLKPIIKQSEVSGRLLVKGYSLADVSVLLALPALVWAADTADTGDTSHTSDTSHTTDTGRLHSSLVFLYSFLLFCNVFTVVYECPVAVTILVLSISDISKYSTSIYITPYLRSVLA